MNKKQLGKVAVSTKAGKNGDMFNFEVKAALAAKHRRNTSRTSQGKKTKLGPRSMSQLNRKTFKEDQIAT